ncbi:hypothetical protein [Streptomyces sp. NPDC048155]|uniref:hypothetical protein n=1 Tax=Streptomyces sp. NPDC048155 TaxID=3154818 RepID=UPI0033FE5A09
MFSSAYRYWARLGGAGASRAAARRPACRRTAYALVVGLCVAVALAPLLQRQAWLFPMPGTRGDCELMGRYQALQAEAALGNLAGSDGPALAFVQENQARKAVAECLAATTTLWLPLYGVGVAVLVGTGAWFRDRARARGSGRFWHG